MADPPQEPPTNRSDRIIVIVRYLIVAVILGSIIIPILGILIWMMLDIGVPGV